MTSTDLQRLDEDWQSWICADCDPTLDPDDPENEYEKPYVLLLPEGEDAPDNCPRCGHYLSFTDYAKGLQITNTPAERYATSQPEEPRS